MPMPANQSNPAENAEAVTPHDSTNLAHIARGLYIGVGGDVSVEMVGTGTAVVFLGAVTGTVLPIQITRVNSTSTDATDMVALY